MLTHFDENGAARMVNVSEKAATVREAVAAGRVRMMPETLRLILDRKMTKGDVFGVARVAGIMATKKTAEVIPLCHLLNLTSADISFDPDEKASCVNIQATVTTTGQTGVEMEALTAVSAAGLTIYDMCKAVDRGMIITDIRLMRKTGGKSGTFERNNEQSSKTRRGGWLYSAAACRRTLITHVSPGTSYGRPLPELSGNERMKLTEPKHPPDDENAATIGALPVARPSDYEQGVTE